MIVKSCSHINIDIRFIIFMLLLIVIINQFIGTYINFCMLHMVRITLVE